MFSLAYECGTVWERGCSYARVNRAVMMPRAWRAAIPSGSFRAS
jgi:hypothetical protein